MAVMSGTTISTTADLIIEDCYKCAVQFAMPISLQRKCKEKGQTFYCPNGHGQVYRTTDLQRARSCADREKKRADRFQAEARHLECRRRGEKSVTTRMKNRLASGVCPCCNKRFPDVGAHISEKHPHYCEK